MTFWENECHGISQLSQFSWKNCNNGESVTLSQFLSQLSQISGAQLRHAWNTYNCCTFMVKNCDICDCLTFQNVIGLICCQWEHWELSGSGQQTDWPLFLCTEFTFWQSDTITLFIFIYFIVIFLWDEYLDTMDISKTW